MLLWILSWLPPTIVHLFIVACAVFYFFGVYFIPPIYKETAKFVAVLLLAFGIYMEGTMYGLSEMKKEVDKANLEIAKLQTQSEKVTVKTITKYVDRVRVVKQKGEERVVYVDRFITQKDNDNCKLPPSFFMLHNSGAENTDAGSTGNADAEATGEVKNNP